MKRPQLTSCRSGRALLALPALAVLLAGCAIGPSGRAAGARPGQATQAADAAPLTAARPDNPNAPGFWYGTDSATIAITTKPPYREPAVSGSPPYGGYIGMAGNWARWSGCGGVLVWSSQDSKAANTNFNTYHKGIGTGVYWFMAGPGVDPRYNGTTSEASSWGAAQAAKTLRAIGGLNVTYKVVWMDIELPGDAPNYTPAQDNGWNNVYTSTCSGRIKTVGCGGVPGPGRPERVRVVSHRALVLHAGGVLLAADLELDLRHRQRLVHPTASTNGPTPTAPGTSRRPRSAGACRSTSTCAHFFGGVTSSSAHAVMWQWSGGGGLTNGVGDFDQIDTNHVS